MYNTFDVNENDVRKFVLLYLSLKLFDLDTEILILLFIHGNV